MKQVKIFYFVILLVWLAPHKSDGQCGGTVPSYTIDMTGSPDSVWTSPSVSRNGLCCSASGSERCIVFYVTLDTLAAAVKMDVVGGLGSTFYQVNCGTAVTLGATTCITGGGLIKITVCKPGGNAQQYKVTSIPKGYVTATSVYVSVSCNTQLTVHNLVSSSITWSAINSAYNSSLSCTSGCATTTATANSSFPSYIDYKVCGTPTNACAGTSFCDTIRVYFLQDLAVTLNPSAGNLCTGASSVNIKATATGGQRPYTYSWTNTADTDSSIDVGVGTYVVTVHDNSLCRVAKDTVVVTSQPLPTPSITGLATVCEKASYTYSVANVSGHSYSWSISNGIIIGSTTSSSVSVRWNGPGSGSVGVTETINTTGCTKAVNKPVSISAAPNTAPIQH